MCTLWGCRPLRAPCTRRPGSGCWISNHASGRTGSSRAFRGLSAGGGTEGALATDGFDRRADDRGPLYRLPSAPGGCLAQEHVRILAACKYDFSATLLHCGGGNTVDIFHNLVLGFEVATTWQNLLFCFVGTL